MSDLTQELVNNATSNLKDSNVYISENANYNDGDKITDLYNGSHAGVVITTSDSLTVYDPNTVASQILQNSPQYNTIILVNYGTKPSYGVSGKNSTQILEKINSNGGNNVTLALTQNNGYIKKMSSNTITTTQVQQHHQSSNTPMVAGGITTGIIVLGLIGAIIMRKLRNNKNSGNVIAQPQGQKSNILKIEDQKNMQESIRNWRELNNNRSTDVFNLTRIIELSKDLINHWNELDNTQVKEETKLIINSEIPKILKLYYSLPNDYQHKKNSDGISPHDTVVEQMKILEDSLDETRKALFDGKIRELEIQSVFVKDKYRKNISNLTIEE